MKVLHVLLVLHIAVNSFSNKINIKNNKFLKKKSIIYGLRNKNINNMLGNECNDIIRNYNTNLLLLLIIFASCH